MHIKILRFFCSSCTNEIAIEFEPKPSHDLRLIFITWLRANNKILSSLNKKRNYKCTVIQYN